MEIKPVRLHPQGQNSDENCHPDLALVTGSLDFAWRPLQLGDDAYDQFWWVWQMQEEWPHWDFAAYWMGHLRHWPRTNGRTSKTGQAAVSAAIWLRQGYSRSQIARALGYSQSSDVPKSLWRRAADYRDWLGDRHPGRLPTPDWMGRLEEMHAAGFDPTVRSPGGMQIRTDPPIVEDPDAPDAADQARRWVRRQRAPRVVTLAEWEREPFGPPEPWSARLLYSDLGWKQLERADARLHTEAPFHAVAA